MTTIAFDDPRDWQNPGVFDRNKEPAHATLIPYPDEALAIAGDRYASPYLLLLNGQWKFYWAPNPQSAPDSLAADDLDASSWDDMRVPASWQTQGDYDPPRYTNVQYPFPIDTYPRVPEEDNPTAVYRTTFEVPAGWQGRQVFLTFEGVESAFHLWVNGKMVGYSQDSRLPAEFDVTHVVRPGVNTIAVRVNDLRGAGGMFGSLLKRRGGTDERWLSGLYVDTPELQDDPYRYYCW